MLSLMNLGRPFDGVTPLAQWGLLSQAVLSPPQTPKQPFPRGGQNKDLVSGQPSANLSSLPGSSSECLSCLWSVPSTILVCQGRRNADCCWKTATRTVMVLKKKKMRLELLSSSTLLDRHGFSGVKPRLSWLDNHFFPGSLSCGKTVHLVIFKVVSLTFCLTSKVGPESHFSFWIQMPSC